MFNTVYTSVAVDVWTDDEGEETDISDTTSDETSEAEWVKAGLGKFINTIATLTVEITITNDYYINLDGENEERSRKRIRLEVEGQEDTAADVEVGHLVEASDCAEEVKCEVDGDENTDPLDDGHETVAGEDADSVAAQAGSWAESM